MMYPVSDRILLRMYARRTQIWISREILLPIYVGITGKYFRTICIKFDYLNLTYGVSIID